MTSLEGHDLDSRRYSLAQYHALIEAGLLDEDTTVELLEGRLVRQSSSDPPHSVATKLVRKFLERAGVADSLVNLHAPITLSTSEPEPDLSLIRGSERDY